MPRRTQALPLLLALSAACGGDPTETAPRYGTAPDTNDKAPARPAPSTGPRFLPGPAEGDIAEHMVAQLEAADAAGDDVLLYVGAEWCEPCQAFHEAVEAGELDEVLPHLRLIEYDLDRDGERLGAADYRSRYIPLFAVPGPDGHASGRQSEGAIKGDGAVEHILRRLVPLIESGRKLRAAAPDRARAPHGRGSG